MDIIVENGSVVWDTATTNKLVAFYGDKKIEVNNCHLGIPPFYDMRVPCLFGNYLDYKDGVYHYKAAFVTYLGNGRYKVRIK